MANTTEYQYVIDSPNLKARYDRLSQIITALENQQLAMVGKSGTLKYSLNDGQTMISTEYRSSAEIAAAITEYEKIRNRVLSELTGTRVKRLADAESVQSNGLR